MYFQDFPGLICAFLTINAGDFVKYIIYRQRKEYKVQKFPDKGGKERAKNGLTINYKGTGCVIFKKKK